ncbi:cytoskeleton protein RodZ [Pantoea sp. Nvir]|uniref:cytoskeleton protein RodZ n=1 Tax=Pantoea sp. Nvir TaxID=2576760 RepID=UPI0027FEDD09|nr:cytoskeleton protein RodZ [Pantoea sp. Nvir]CAJ0992228.1 Cytoskeleton protein RodZ [Pantoea sp. Nvir]
MNIEITQDNSVVNSPGERLRLAREKMGLTQQNVAERLCLKISTIRDIEENKSPADLAATFLRGYIRSYARLVHISEEELLPMMAKQPARTVKIEPMQNLSFGKCNKKREGWLMIFTWLLLLMVVSLTCVWWWQNHKASQADLVSMVDQSSSSRKNSQSIPLTLDGSGNSTRDNIAKSLKQNKIKDVVVPTATSATNIIAPSINQALVDNAANTPLTGHQLLTNAHTIIDTDIDYNHVVMGFKADCWVEVIDATSKKLFSGMQRNGDRLNLSGIAPYRLIIGVPSAVQIQYQKKMVNLSRFVQKKQVARLTLGVQ